ncbi:unnamed protein product [Zymoseptoria tritici ST99CH_1A5]|uniref:Chromo domain-containing protein n=1 Tax=Zymoseptoria tritici ST99CH_1A5 TaxID=1276529 RepID=A0A1Y6LUI5_ZYMTR|nr:unnamed protein product [Zymoseptoria tritici ST99CH_1A5]
MAKWANEHRKDISFNVGDEVYLNTRNIRSLRPSAKLDHKYIGPYKVKAVINRVAYTLDLPDLLKIYPTFYVSLLELSIPDQFGRKQDRMMRYDAGEDNEYEVEAILAERVDELNNREYLIKWKDYDWSENSWEAAVNISPAAMRAYRRRMGQKGPTARGKFQKKR